MLAHTHDEQFPCSRRCAILAVRSSGSMLATIFKATPSPRSIGGFCGRMRPASEGFDFGGFVAPTAGGGSRSERPQEIKVERSRFLSSMESGRTFLIEITHSSGRSLGRGPPLAESALREPRVLGRRLTGTDRQPGARVSHGSHALLTLRSALSCRMGLAAPSADPRAKPLYFRGLGELGDGGR